ncbi:hypothetical protein H5410_056309, partial [Solanum commersonii]
MSSLDYCGGKLNLEQLTPNQMGSSRTPTCRIRNMSKQANSEESKSPKPKLLVLKPFESSTDHSASLVKIADQLDDPPFDRFHRRLALFFSIIMLSTLEQKARIRPFGDLPNVFDDSQCPFFPSNSKYLKLKALTESHLWTHQHPQLKLLLVVKQNKVQPFKKSVLNSARQESIMNAHNKTQFTYAKIKCALKDSSCDSLISKNLMLTLLSSNASSSSTKMFKCPHTRNDSILAHNGLQFKAAELNATLTLTKMNTMHTFTHKFACIFRSTFFSSHSRSKRSFQ